MVLELTVSLKDSEGERSYSKKFLIYDQIVLNQDSTQTADIDEMIKETIHDFGEHPDTCKVRIVFQC